MKKMFSTLNKMAMKIKLFKYISILGIILIFSCKKQNRVIIPNTNINSFESIFDSFWLKMNSNYVYWDIDTTNWDRVYTNYKPIFNDLDIHKISDVKKSVGLFKEITSGLIDYHFYINFLPLGINDSMVYPALIQKQNNSDFYTPYNYFQVDKNYMDKGYQLIFDNNYSRNGVPLTVLVGTIKSKIIYFNCNQFKLMRSYLSNSPNTIKPAIDSFFKMVQYNSMGYNGIIIDVRSNQGGDLWDLNFLLSNFITTPLHYGYLQSKSNNNRLDFTPWLPSIINPSKKYISILPRIIVLGDKNSASLSETTILAIKTIPGSLFVGETTWGATGPVVDNDVLNDGSFKVGSFMKVQASSAKFKYLDGFIYESKGINPDYNIRFDIMQLKNGIDKGLEKAIELLQ